MRPARPPARAIPDAKTECPVPTIDRIASDRRPDIARPANPGRREQGGVAGGRRDGNGGWILAALDPVGAARHREVAVAVDHAGNDGRPAGIDELETIGRPGIFLTVGGADPGDPVTVDQDAHSQLEGVAPAIRERSTAIEDATVRRR
jgi:hypothetical protein